MIGIPKDFKISKNPVSVSSFDWPLRMMNIQAAHDAGIEGQDISIGYLDTGVNRTHPDLPHDVKGWHYSDYSDDVDRNGHGSGVTFCIHSVGPRFKTIHGGKSLGDNGNGPFESIAEGLRFLIDSEVDIISLSLGADSRANSLDINRLLKEAYEKNIIVFISSGNEGDDVGYPANQDTPFAVGAVDSRKRTTSFSNFGRELDFTGPGKDVRLAWVDKTWEIVSGTSFSCPFVAAFCGLILCDMKRRGMTWTVDLIKKIMTLNCEDIGSDGFDPETGCGLPRAGKGEPFILSTEDNPTIEEPEEEIVCTRNGWQRFWDSILGRIV